jgi:hypothetical protein
MPRDADMPALTRVKAYSQPERVKSIICNHFTLRARHVLA